MGALSTKIDDVDKVEYSIKKNSGHDETGKMILPRALR